MDRRRASRLGVALAAGLLMAGTCSGPVLPPPTSPRLGSPVPLSGASPFHTCRQQGQVSLDSEVEPSLAVDPADPGRLLAAWQQDRNFRGGALGILAAWSVDGGRTWEATTPQISACAGGGYDLASDPAVSIGLDRAYLAAIGIEIVASGSETSLDDEVVVAATADGGRTWAEPVVVETSADPLVSFDKETVLADAHRSGTAYVLWVRYTRPAPNKAAKTNETFVSRTTDGGATWSSPTVAYAADTETQFHQLIGLAEGVLLDVFVEAPTLSDRPPVKGRLAVISSADQGVTWTSPATVADIHFTMATDPTGKDHVRGTGQGILAAADPRGPVYVAWAEQHPGSGSFLAVVRSDDGGRTWTSPARIVSGSSGQPLVPQIAVAGDGTVGVTWYQLAEGDHDELSTDVWLAWSTDRGASWQSLRLAGPFDLHTAPLSADGDFVGDYEGLVGMPDGFAAAYTMAKPLSRSGPTDIFFSRFELGPFP